MFKNDKDYTYTDINVRGGKGGGQRGSFWLQKVVQQQKRIDTDNNGHLW
jgi:hypothetical protein